MLKSAKVVHRNISQTDQNDTHELKTKKKKMMSISTKNESKYSSLSLAVSFLLCAILWTGEWYQAIDNFDNFFRLSSKLLTLTENLTIVHYIEWESRKNKIAHVKLSIQCWFFSVQFALSSLLCLTAIPIINAMMRWAKKKNCTHITKLTSNNAYKITN